MFEKNTPPLYGTPVKISSATRRPPHSAPPVLVRPTNPPLFVHPLFGSCPISDKPGRSYPYEYVPPTYPSPPLVPSTVNVKPFSWTQPMSPQWSQDSPTIDDKNEIVMPLLEDDKEMINIPKFEISPLHERIDWFDPQSIHKLEVFYRHLYSLYSSTHFYINFLYLLERFNFVKSRIGNCLYSSTKLAGHNIKTIQELRSFLKACDDVPLYLPKKYFQPFKKLETLLDEIIKKALPQFDQTKDFFALIARHAKKPWKAHQLQLLEQLKNYLLEDFTIVDKETLNKAYKKWKITNYNHGHQSGKGFASINFFWVDLDLAIGAASPPSSPVSRALPTSPPSI